MREVLRTATSAFPTFDLVGTAFSGIAALGGVVALVIAIRALNVSRETVVLDQLFVAFSELIASLQEIGRVGTKLGLQAGGEARSREVIDNPFQRFLGARARVDLATETLGIRGAYSDSILNLVNNFAAGVLQAEEFGPMKRDRLAEEIADRSWADDLTWAPDETELAILAQSISFEDLRTSMSLIDPQVAGLRDLDEWWGRRIADPDSQHDRSVYSVNSSYLVQTSRLLEDFTREYVQPMCEAALRLVARTSKRQSRPLTFT